MMYTIRTAAETLGLREKWVRYHVQRLGLGQRVGGVLILVAGDIAALVDFANTKLAAAAA